jgi:hypothetical protein
MRGRLQKTFLVLAALSAAEPARASLGGTAASVEVDRSSLSAARRATVARAGYTIHEVDDGVVLVREYVSAAGVVFAVAWNGIARPDLDTLLGPYAQAFHDAERLAPRSPGQRHRAYTVPNLVVEQWGHMRSQRGRAYDPALLPPEVSPGDIL